MNLQVASLINFKRKEILFKSETVFLQLVFTYIVCVCKCKCECGMAGANRCSGNLITFWYGECNEEFKICIKCMFDRPFHDGINIKCFSFTIR